jgi:hypothetical protein
MPWSPHRTVISRAATITALITLLLAAGCTGRSASSGASGDGGASAAGSAQAGGTPDTPATTAFKPSTATSPPPPPVKPLPKDVAHLITVTNSTMTTGTFAATYNLTQTSQSGARHSRLVLKGTKFRFEHTLANTNRRQVIIFDGKLMHDCQANSGEPMQCQLTTSTVFDQATFGAEHPNMLMAQIESMNVLVGRGMNAAMGKRIVLGMPLRCVVFTPNYSGAVPREACMTRQGVIAYVKINGISLVMTGFTTKVSDREFLEPK